MEIGQKVAVVTGGAQGIDTTGSDITGPDAVQQPAGRVGKPEDIASMVMFLSLSVQERLCELSRKEINERTHEECRDYRACADDCSDTGNGSAGEEIEYNSDYYTDDIGNYPHILEFADVPSV
jgi:hypothetical protein